MKQPKNTLKTRTVFVFRSTKKQLRNFDTNPTDATTATFTTTATGSGVIFQ
ncbi:hypothetical protein [Pedobacter kyonggii]|uniref:hypothetical protein n=1 Tax=Pedobacter kyonggii TaxID=1926871 RepID=UPI0013EF1D65|nr:hypothetical protein [Pedobacter kyonggii]